MKKTIFFLSLIFLIFFIYNELPYKNLPPNYQFFLSIIRILYFSVFIIYLFKLKELSYIQFNENYKELNILCNILIAVSLLIVLGIFTKFFILFHFLLYLYLYRKSRANFYSIEQSYHQIIGIFFIFSNSNLYFSFDKLFKIDHFLMFKDNTSFNFLVLSISVCLISGFYEKLKSPVWKSGKALNIFLNLPHIKKIKFDKLFQKLISNKYLCYLALANQALLFFLIFENFRILFYFGELIFSIMLIFLVPFYFIGETFILIFSFLIITDLNLLSTNQLLEIKNNQIDHIFIDFLLGFILINSFIACFYKTSNFLSNINRYTLGLYPFSVYTEYHMYGIRVFKISGFKDNVLIYNNMFEVYNEHGYVGKQQKLMPSIIHALTYRVTDICERRLNNNLTKDDEKIIINTFNNVLNLNKKKIKNINNLKFYIKTINPTNTINDQDNWIDKEWSEIAQFSISKKSSFQWTGLPSIAIEIFRKNIINSN
jgi:hypothetical protein